MSSPIYHRSHCQFPFFWPYIQSGIILTRLIYRKTQFKQGIYKAPILLHDYRWFSMFASYAILEG
jgi:hypothetical protein